MAQCPICGASQDVLPPLADAFPAEITAEQHPVPSPRRFLHEDLAFPPVAHVAGEFVQPPRFAPASPLPLEFDEWNTPNDQRKPRPRSVPPELRFSPTPPPPVELCPDPEPDLASAADDMDHLAGIALPHLAASLPAETSSEQHPDAPTPTPRRFLHDNQAFLPMFSPGAHVSDEFARLRFSCASPLPPTQSKRNAPAGRWRARNIFIILAVLLLLAGSGGYIAFSKYWSGLNSPPVMLNTRSIPRTINAPATATATARAATTNPYVSGGTLIFADTLQAANSHWDQNANCAFKGGGYHVMTTTIQSCSLNGNIPLTNFVLEVRVTLLRGNVGGLFFRENKVHNRSNAYLLDFDSKGNYQLWNYNVSHAAKLIDYGTLSHLNAGYNKTNTIALVAQGSNIRLYVNRQMVKHFIDHTYTHGGLSFISSEYSSHKGTTEASYSDLRLWRL